MMREDIRTNLVKIWSSQRKLARLLKGLLVANGILLVVFLSIYVSNHFLFLGPRSPLDQGLTTLKQHVMADPGDPSARLQLAALYFERGEYAQVIKQGETVLQTDSQAQDALYLTALSYLQTGYPHKAIPLLTQFVDLRQASNLWRTDRYLQEALYYLGAAYLQTEQPALAQQLLDLALVIDHTDSDARFLLGQAYAGLGQIEKASEQYFTALEFVPDYEAVYLALSNLGDDPGQPGRLYFSQAGLAYCRRDYPSALQQLQRAVEAQTQFTPAYVLLGLVYEELGDLDQAQQAMEMALVLDPDNFLAQHVLGRMAAVIQGMSGSEP